MENQSLTSFVNFVEKHYSKFQLIEKISLASLIAGTIMYYWFIPYYGIFIVSGAVLGCLTYFLISYKIVESENLETTGILNSIGFINFIYKLSYYSLAVSCIAMLDLIVNFKNGNSIMYIGGITLICILVISLFTNINDRTVIYNSAFYIRILLVLLLLSSLAMQKFGII